MATGTSIRIAAHVYDAQGNDTQGSYDPETGDILLSRSADDPFTAYSLMQFERLHGLFSLTYKESRTTASLGIAWGSQDDEVRLLDRGDTPEIQRARQLAKENGLKPVFFGQGDLTIRGKQTRAYLSGGVVFLRTDDPDYPVEKLMRSALAHSTGKQLLFVTASYGQTGWVPLDQLRTSIDLKSLEPEIRGHHSTESETTHREMAAERQEHLTGQSEEDIMGFEEATENLAEEERAALVDYKSATSYRINAY